MKADSAPATVQVSVEVRRIHTPERRAESAFSDMARMDRPHEVKRTASTRTTVTMGATMSVSTSVGVMMNGPERERQVEGHRHRLVEVGGPDERQRGQRQQHVAQPDGGHHDEHAGTAEEPAQHQLGQGADEGGQPDGEHQGEPVVEVEVRRELDQEHGGDDADLALGEVQDPVGAVDEDQAQRQQPVAQAVEEALDEDEVRGREREHGRLATARRRRCRGRRGAAGRRGP